MIAAGIHPSVPMADYIADPCPTPSASAHFLWEGVSRSWAHARIMHPRLAVVEHDDTSASDLGSAAHSAVLGGQTIVLIDAPDWRTKMAREQRDAARAGGEIPVLAKNADELDGLVHSARAAFAARGIDPRQSRCEHTLIWQEGGVWCRSRPDLISADGETIIDLKTCADAGPGQWIRRTMLPSGHHMSAAHQLAGLAAVEPGPEREFLFLVQERVAPYACSWVGLSPQLLDLAQRQRQWALAQFAECLATKKWPGYGAATHYAECPAWMEEQHMIATALDGQEVAP